MSPEPPKFENPPLLCVVFAITFTPLPKMKEYVHDLHEDLRMRNFPDYHQHEGNAVEFASSGTSEPRVAWQKVLRWDITSDDKKTLIRIDERSVTIHFANYRDFNENRTSLKQILEAIEKSIPQLKVTSLTLRYINHIPLQEKENPTQWVTPALLGLSSQPSLGLNRKNSLTETVFETGEGSVLVVRCSAFAEGLTVPPDLLPLDFEIKTHADHPFLTLENLHHLTGSEILDSSEILGKLDKLRHPIAVIFAGLTTPKAHEVWKIQTS